MPIRTRTAMGVQDPGEIDLSGPDYEPTLAGECVCRQCD